MYVSRAALVLLAAFVGIPAFPGGETVAFVSAQDPTVEWIYNGKSGPIGVKRHKHSPEKSPDAQTAEQYGYPNKPYPSPEMYEPQQFGPYGNTRYGNYKPVGVNRFQQSPEKSPDAQTAEGYGNKAYPSPEMYEPQQFGPYGNTRYGNYKPQPDGGYGHPNFGHPASQMYWQQSGPYGPPYRAFDPSWRQGPVVYNIYRPEEATATHNPLEKYPILNFLDRLHKKKIEFFRHIFPRD